MNKNVRVWSPESGKIIGSPVVSSSKSESNRALILWAFSGQKLQVRNLSTAKDTQILLDLLQSESDELDAQDAGTAFRFLTAYLALTGRNTILTGTERMLERPVGILVDALRSLGAKIEYLNQPGYPPLRFSGFLPSQLSEITMDASVSSQFISALLLAAPSLPKGLIIWLSGHAVASGSYLNMTWNMLETLGFQGSRQENRIEIFPQPYPSGNFVVETDWSSAGYWFAMAAIAESADFYISNLKTKSNQGDSVIQEIVQKWGVSSVQKPGGVHIFKKERIIPTQFSFDFTSTPDLGQTIIALCAATGTEGHFKGLKSLAIKETNRLLAMQTELNKIGILIDIDEEAGTCYLKGKQQITSESAEFDTYLDHRMAMSLSLLSFCLPVTIRNSAVVEKSYPEFWTALHQAGFRISQDG